MTIKPGNQWGEPVNDALTVVDVRSDAELAASAYRALRQGSGHQVGYLLKQGDLLTALGLVAARDKLERRAYRFDLGLAAIDSKPAAPFVAHAIARRSLWTGRFVAAMNVGWSGDRYVAPKAHPNDGKLDIIEGTLGIQQRYLAYQRAKTGSHLPHPDLRLHRRQEATFSFERSVTLYLDGHKVNSGRSLELSLLADACVVVA